MNETVLINWLLLISHFLWISGVAVMFASVSIAVYVNRKQHRKLKEYFKTPTMHWMIWSSAFLLVSGLLLFQFKLPSQNLVVVHVKPANNGTPLMTVGDMRMSLLPRQLRIDPQNRSHPVNNEKMKNDTIALFWDGFVSTPYMHFLEGEYHVRFQARGTEAAKEFSKIKVEFESPDRFGYLKIRKKVYITLNEKMNRYSLSFPVPQATTGRIRITYYNDLQIAGTGKGRDVWLRDITITSTR